MQKNNSEMNDSGQEMPAVGIDETSSDWEFSGITFFRALGYVVGLLSFMVGTALFMLGFSLANETLVQVATFLYGLAVMSLVGRIVIQRYQPRNELQAVWVAMLMLGTGGIVYVGLTLIISIAHLI